MMPFLIGWTIVIVLLPGPLSHAVEIVGHWVDKNQAGNNVYFVFGPEDEFYVEDETSWIQGTYTIEPDSVPGQLNLYIQEGSNIEDVGKAIRYRYHIQDNYLTLTGANPGGTDHPTTLEALNPAGSTAFIGINTDPSDKVDENDEDKDDYNWAVYASCFVMSSMTELKKE